MKPTFLWVTAAFLFSALGSEAAQDARQARANYQNLTSAQPSSQANNPGVASFNGYIKGPGDVQTPNTIVLQQCAFGQPFSQWFPSENYSRDLITSVKAALYPDLTQAGTRNAIQNSGKPFRYKFLMYQSSGSDVTAFDATSIAGWFTDADRNAIYAQIDLLKAAIAASPLDAALRNTLLDIFYDLSVAEMQAVKPQLAQLARYHLGIDLPPLGQFVIDKEIETYSNIVATITKAISQYQRLLVDPIANIDPSSFDSKFNPGTVPMGQYVFRKAQPKRNSTPSQYADSSGVQEVPQIVDGQLVTPQTLYTGYKDLNALYQIIGQRALNLAALARLLGSRQAAGDLQAARQSIETLSKADAADLEWIKGWFPELFPQDVRLLSPAQVTAFQLRQEQSGILASLSAIESGRSEMAGVVPFLNGSANVLGYDPNFLLVVQDNSGTIPPKDSFDTLHSMLIGLNKPLTVALNKLNSTPGVNPPDGAIYLYNNFVQKAENVADDIDDADEALADRFQAITGFEPDETPGFDFANPNPRIGSELYGAMSTIANLSAQSAERGNLTKELESQFKVNANGTVSGTAVEAINDAQEKYDALLGAAQSYKEKTRPMYTEMIGMSAGAAASQALTDGWNALTGIDAGTQFVTGGSLGYITAGVNLANTAMQTAAAAVIGQNERDLDYAGMDFTVTTSLPDAVLAKNQAQQGLSTIKREQIANKLSILADQGSLGQAQAQKASLLNELSRIQKKRDATVASIRKKSYADPLSYYRAEAALIDADESFRTAQRWMFYLVQALNYKWNGKFAITQGSKSYDSSTVFKCRNANELNELLTQMVQWDAVRVSQTTSSPLIYSRISLFDHILARNPRRFDPVDSSDPGMRADDTLDPAPPVAPTVSRLQYFRNVLARKYQDASGNLVIPFATFFRNELPDRVDGNFFRGASYDANGIITDPGFWREKIDYVKVNIVAANAPALPANLSGALAYGGLVYFHTRVPPRSNRTIAGLLPDDYPGELMATPFRFWVSPDFSQNFVAQDHHTVSIPVAYSQSSAVIQTQNGIQDNLGSTFQVNAFAGRSIAASDWRFRINRLNTGGFVVDVNNIQDIELIIAYRHSDRAYPPN